MPSRDPRAVARLLEVYPQAFAVVRRRYPSLCPADHEDIVHEAFANVLVRLDRAPVDDPGHYLLRAALNAAADALRRRRAPLPLNGDGDHAGAELERRADPSLAPLTPEEHVLSRADCEQAWRRLTSALTRTERIVLVRRAYERRSPQEIAAELGISLRSYRRTLEQAGRKLTVPLDDLAPAPPSARCRRPGVVSVPCAPT